MLTNRKSSDILYTQQVNYFTTQPNEQLKKKLIKYMNKFNNEWLEQYLDKYIDIKFYF